MAKRELFDHRITGPIMRACRHIEVDRADGERSLAVARDFLDRGEVVGIFPEATISRAMEIKNLKTGAARIAHAAGVPLVPLVVWGTQRMPAAGGFTEKGMKVLLQQTAPRLGVDPDKVAIAQIADVSFLREVQREMGIKCRDGYGC